jgi:hypothetical protein
LPAEGVLRVEQGFNATEQLCHSIAFWRDRRYAENLGERHTELVLKHREDHDWSVRRSDMWQRRNMISVS